MPLSIPLSDERRIARSDLAEDPERVFDAVHRGQTIVVEEDGHPEAAIIDMVDFQILRAVLSYHAGSSAVDPEAGLSDDEVAGLSGQELVDVALAHYLDDSISLSRAAEVLRTTWVELRRRLARLGVPVWTAPEDDEGVLADLRVARSASSA